jgi:hypothetical protein
LAERKQVLEKTRYDAEKLRKKKDDAEKLKK